MDNYAFASQSLYGLIECYVIKDYCLRNKYFGKTITFFQLFSLYDFIKSLLKPKLNQSIYLGH